MKENTGRLRWYSTSYANRKISFITKKHINANILRPWLLASFLIFSYIFVASLGISQALDAAHALENIEVSNKGKPELVLLIPSEFEPEKWFYATRTLHFGEQEISGQNAPEMTLLRYQRRDPDNPHNYIEGATLQLAISIDPLDDAAKRDLLRKAKLAAEKWEHEFSKELAAHLKESAEKQGPKQENWRALHTAFEKAHSRDLATRNNKNTDSLIDQALNDDLDRWAVEGLLESARLLKMRNPVSISALPIATAQLTLYDESGHAAQTAGLTRGAAPEYATDKLTFTIQLDRNAADICEALLTSHTGIFMILRREYEVLSSPLAHEIVIDYDRALREYRSNPSFLHQAVLFAAYQSPDLPEKNRETISERFERGILRAFDKNGQTVPLASVDTKTIQTLVGRVNRAVLQDEWAPGKVDLKAVSSSRTPKYLGAEDLAFPAVRESGSATKNPERKPPVEVIELSTDASARGGTETLPPGYRYRDRKSVTTQGFLSLTVFDQSVRDRLILDEKTPEWANAYFLLPGIGNDPQIGVFKTTTRIALHIKKQKWLEQTATWDIKDGWTLQGHDKPAAWGIISFPLREARQKYREEELLKSEFRVNQEISCNLDGKIFDELKAEYSVKVFDGKSMIASPLECIQPIIFDFSNFSWRIPQLILYGATIEVTQKLGTATIRLKRRALPGKELKYLPVLINSTFENDLGTVSADIVFPSRFIDKESGRRTSGSFKWILNKQNLVELYPALFVSIFDEDRIK